MEGLSKVYLITGQQMKMHSYIQFNFWHFFNTQFLLFSKMMAKKNATISQLIEHFCGQTMKKLPFNNLNAFIIGL